MADRKDATRTARLRAVLAKVLNGKETIVSRNAQLFLEAISDQPEPTTCIQRIVASPHGLLALQTSLSSSNSLEFLNGAVASLLQYIRAPALKTVCGGEVLRKILLKFVDTPLTWEAFQQAAKSGTLSQRALDGFAWLLLQLLHLPAGQSAEY